MNTNTKPGTTDTILNSNQLWSRYIAYWPLYIVMIVLFLGLAWSYLKIKVPEYEITASVLVKDERKGVVSEQKNGENLNQVVSTKIVDNEIEVIQARTILDQVVSNLFLYAPVSEKKGFRSVSAYATSPVKIQLKNPGSISSFSEAQREKVKKIYFTYNSSKAKVVIGNKEYSMNEWLSTDYGIIRFLSNRFSTDSTNHNYFFSLIDPRVISADLHDNLKAVSPVKTSSIIDLTFKDKDRQRGEEILNEVIRLYENLDFEDKNNLARNTLQFVESRLRSVGHDLDSIERKVQSYKKSENAVDIPQQGTLYLQNVSAATQRLSEVNVQLSVLDQIQGYVQSKSNFGGIVPSALGIENTFLTEMLNNLSQKELQYADLKKTVAENNPMLTSLTDQIQKLKSSILETIQNQRKNLETSKSALTATNNSYASSLQALPQKERELIEITRQQDMLNKVYSYLLQQREESALTSASTVSSNRIIDRAQSSPFPGGPKPMILYLAAIAAALVTGIAIITMRETFNSKILYRREIEKSTSFPVIAEIAYKSLTEPVAIENKKNAAMIEQFRKLQVSLNYLHINGKRKKIMITSSISGEGKSFIAKNLAVTLAKTGKKVILFEGDINFPTLSSDIGISNEPGITNYLSDECDLGEIVKRTALNENLFILPPGSYITNYTELLMKNNRVQEMFSSLEAMFDYIIIDTTPVETATDAYILSEYCDATLYVVRQNFTPKFFVQRLDETSKINPLKNMAVVFNGVHSRGFGKNNYGMGYGYSYFEDTQRRLNSKKNPERKMIDNISAINS